MRSEWVESSRRYDIKLSHSVPWILHLLGTFIDTFAEKLFECTLKMQTSIVCIFIATYSTTVFVFLFSSACRYCEVARMLHFDALIVFEYSTCFLKGQSSGNVSILQYIVQ
jgi:hypothetical protein